METLDLNQFWSELEDQWKMAFVQGVFKRDVDWSLKPFNHETQALAHYEPSNSELTKLAQASVLKLKGKGGGDLNFNLSNVSGLIQLSRINQQLEELYLDYNNIQSMEGLVRFQHLKTLNVSDNVISELSISEDHKSLETLSISTNYLKSTAGIEHFVHLEYLYMSENRKLENLDGLEKLSHLKSVSMQQCPMLTSETVEQLQKVLVGCQFNY